MQQSLEKCVIRLPNGMREALRSMAKANRRSMNAEIVYRLDRALAAQEAKGPAEGATSPSHGPSKSAEEKAHELQPE